jgi:hypothetical protein
MICVDKRMSYLYGQEGHWIIHGHPLYVAIGQKPKIGCEIEYAGSGTSGGKLRLELLREMCTSAGFIER